MYTDDEDTKDYDCDGDKEFRFDKPVIAALLILLGAIAWMVSS